MTLHHFLSSCNLESVVIINVEWYIRMAKMSLANLPVRKHILLQSLRWLISKSIYIYIYIYIYIHIYIYIWQWTESIRKTQLLTNRHSNIFVVHFVPRLDSWQEKVPLLGRWKRSSISLSIRRWWVCQWSLLNGGTCSHGNGTNEFTCACVAGYEGTKCKTGNRQWEIQIQDYTICIDISRYLDMFTNDGFRWSFV